jgi:hypothetical protein
MAASDWTFICTVGNESQEMTLTDYKRSQNIVVQNINAYENHTELNADKQAAF